MNVQQAAIAVFVTTLAWVNLAYADDIEIIADSAKVKVENEVIASVKKGERFQVVKRQGDWVAIAVRTEQGPREGWILVSQVRILLQPGIDEDTPAPGPPVLIELGADLTQFSGRGTSGASVYFQLSITNQDTKPAPFKVDDFVLELDGAPIKPSSRSTGTSYSYYRIYSDPSMRTSQPSQSLDYLQAGTLAPDETATGWLCFQIPRFRQVRELAAKEWIISATVAGKSAKLDLKDAEMKALAAKVRPSSFDASVRVIEIGSRLNALNVGRFLDVLEPIVIEDSGCLVMPEHEVCLFDDYVYREIQSAAQRSKASILFAGFPSTLRNRLGNYFMSSGLGPQFATTETTAVMQLLGTRSGSGPALAKHLADSSTETRIAAAGALATHTAEAGVIDALLKAALDEKAGIRAAAIGSLGKADDLKATEAVIQAMSDPETNVRWSAAGAAGDCRPEAVVDALVKLLDDAQSSVVVAACGSLGRLKAKDAAPRLQQLQAAEELALQVAAIDALKAIGVLSELEAALAKLDGGRLSTTEFEILAKADDSRVVPGLLEGMKFRGSDSYYIDQMARVLGGKGDPAAVEALIDALEHGYSSSGEVPRALGKLGDKRAIKPLQDALKRGSSSYSGMRSAIYEALLTLDAPGVFEQAVDELKRSANSYSVGQMIGVLGQSGNKRAVPVVAPYLDDQTHNRAAVDALTQIGTPEAFTEIKRRLLKEDYAYGAIILSQLYQKRTPEAVALLREATTSPNESVRRTAHSYAGSLNQVLASELRGRIQTHLNNQQWAAAGEAFQTAVKDQLKVIDVSPSQVSGFAAFVSDLASSYRSVNKADLADEQLEKTIGAVQEKIKAGAAAELSSQLAQLRARRILFALDAGTPENAARIMSTELDAAKKAFEDSPDDITNVLRLANALETRTQFVSRTAPAELAAARKDSLDFLFEQTKKHPNDDRMVAVFVSGQIGGLNSWAPSDPVGAEKHLKLVQDFIGGLKSDNAAATTRLEKAKQSFESSESTIRYWKERADAETRAVADLEKLGGKAVAVGGKSSWSPDGEKIVYGKMPFGAGLQILDRATGKITDLVPSGKDAAWSPDGRFIAYVAEPSVNAYQAESVWLVKPSGGEPRRIADGGFPTWSSDGKTLFVHSRKERTLFAIDVYDPQAHTSVLLPNLPAYYPAVSPDRKRIAFGMRDELVIVDRETGERLLTWPTPGNRGLLPAWSPDGKWVGFGGFDNCQLGLWALDVDAQQAVQLTKGPFTMPSWSRDGKQLAFDRRSSNAREVWTIETSVLSSLKMVSREQAATGPWGDAAQLELSKINLKRIGIAMHTFHDTHKCFPPAVIFGPDGKPWHSWRVLLLPFLDQADLYRRYRFDEPWDGPNNRKLLSEMPRVYRDPVYGDGDDYDTHYAVPTGDAVAFAKEGIKMVGDGKKGLGSVEGARRIVDFTDGTSNSLLAGSVNPEREIPWMKPEDVIVGEGDSGVGSLGEFAAPYMSELGSAGVFLFADGAVKTIRSNIDPATFRALLTIAGAEIAGPF